MNYLTYFAVILYCIFSIWRIRCFLYQRTLLTLERKENISVRNVTGVYPKSYLVTNRLSFLRFIILAYLVFTKWYLALILAITSFSLSLLIRVNDSKHLHILVKQISFNTGTSFHHIRQKAGKGLAYTDNDDIYLNIGKIISVPVCNEVVSGEVVNVNEVTKELVVLFAKEFGINNSFPHDIHYLSISKLDKLHKGELMTDFIHYR